MIKISPALQRQIKDTLYKIFLRVTVLFVCSSVLQLVFFLLLTLSAQVSLFFSSTIVMLIATMIVLQRFFLDPRFQNFFGRRDKEFIKSILIDAAPISIFSVLMMFLSISQN